MYVLCIDSGNGYEYIRPEKGIVYSATKKEFTNKKCGKCGSHTYYELSSIKDFIHSECLFEPVPDDILTNLNKVKQIQIVQNG